MEKSNYRVRIDAGLHQRMLAMAKRNRRNPVDEYSAAAEFYLKHQEENESGGVLHRIEAKLTAIMRHFKIKTDESG